MHSFSSFTVHPQRQCIHRPPRRFGGTVVTTFAATFKNSATFAIFLAMMLSSLQYSVNGLSNIIYHPVNPFVVVSGTRPFVVNHHHHHHHHHWERPATMYLPDDWVDDDDNDSMTTTTKSGIFGATNSMIPPILQTPEWVAPLARLAAGYTPNGMALNIQHIERVSVRNVAPSHVDIEAVVCEQDGCVSLSVPVPFTQPCVPNENHHHNSQSYDPNFEDCVIRNIQELDSVQLQKAKTTHHPQQQQQQQGLSDDTNMENIEYPSWWIYPGTAIEFAKECTALLGILNEPDFIPDVVTLVTKALRRILSVDHLEDTSSILQVQHALAVAVGPSGMIFRVHAMYQGQMELVDVPVPFSTNGLVSVRDNDPKALRDAVLDCVENAAAT
jgi:hypothetical protein